MSFTDPKYRHYLHDLGLLIKERAREAKAKKLEQTRGSPDLEFESGRLLAFNEVVSIMQQQAEGFDIPLSELQLEDVEPDRDLV